MQITIEGVLDRESVPLLRQVYEDHSRGGRKIRLELEGLLHICRQGMDFLQEIEEKVAMGNPPRFLRWKDQNSKE